ncbi:MAG: hypothetical protein CR982_03570 [Candidatus Cloacimonadota bacterium]|nr:MAG: hypothetical protein CR982_03570 [Candidatus Cloacimonadota bacterium]PIE78309.1 MAG: hypothetical protein CSA15_08435 [Candidatus Delongbacteria bacterium]
MARPVKKLVSIENAAIELFAEKSITGTVIKDIAKRANVTEGALYRHYVSKDEMAWKLFERELNAFSQGLKEIFLNSEGTTEEKVLEGIDYLYSYYDEKPSQFAFILITQHNFKERDWLTESDNPTDLLFSIIGKDITKDINPEIFSGVLMGIVLQPIVMHWYGRFSYDINEIKKNVIMAAKKLFI